MINTDFSAVPHVKAEQHFVFTRNVWFRIKERYSSYGMKFYFKLLNKPIHSKLQLFFYLVNPA